LGQHAGRRLRTGRSALRLGFRQIDGFREDWAKEIVDRRMDGYHSAEEVWRRSGVPKAGLKTLANADAFRSTGLDRRNALWAVRRLPDDVPLPLFEAARSRELADEPHVDLPDMALAEHVVADYQTTRLSLKAHPMALLRDVFRAERVLSSQDMATKPDGAWVQVAGVVLIRQRPGKGNAIFITLEDEVGIVNVVLWARQFERFRRVVMGAKLMVARGRIQKSKEGVIHLMATSLHDRTQDLDTLSDSHQTRLGLSRADEVIRPQIARGDSAKGSLPASRHSHPRNVRIIPKSRDFH
jgi:error-prone DNA polymerase